jgi:hypothetical protein
MDPVHLLRLPHLDAFERHDWEVRLQVTWIAPPRVQPAISGLQSEPKSGPRVNLVLSVSRLEDEAPPEASAAATKFLEQTERAVPRLRIEEGPTAFVFNDKQAGVRVVISFPATEEVDLQQHHLFRIDERHCTQVVVTRDARADDDDFWLALETARSFGSPFDQTASGSAASGSAITGS